MIRFNKFIKMRRLELGITQAELARSLGMKSNQHLCNVEAGKAPMPNKYYKPLRRELRLTKTTLRKVLVRDYIDFLEEWL